MQKIDLVFRSIGERTATAALEQAIKNINPHRVHIIENIKPFALAVKQMLTIDYQSDFVVFMDADCLIMEDMSKFLQRNSQPYIDCYVRDRFRGLIHCGVHITRIDLVRAMQEIQVQEPTIKLVLRPESALRKLALRKLNLVPTFKQFLIFHDYFQFYQDIFAKYALRELRSRTQYSYEKLSSSQSQWQPDHDLDLKIAEYAISYARRVIPEDTPIAKMAEFIAQLPEIAAEEISKLNIIEKPAFQMLEVENLMQKNNFSVPNDQTKVFGIGLSRTATKSLTLALNILGISVIHYPNNAATYHDLVTGNYKFSVLEDFQGITDITVVPYYAQLDKLFPGSKFILTTRDRTDWLNSMETHWKDKPIVEDAGGDITKIKLRQFLRAAVYGIHNFDRERLGYIYDLHHKNVLEYFRDRPEDLLIINICQGEGWDKLCPFLRQPLPTRMFPLMDSKSKLNQSIT